MKKQNIWQEKIQNCENRNQSIYFIIVFVLTFVYRIFRYGPSDPIMNYLQLIIGGSCIVNIFTYLVMNYTFRKDPEYQRFKKEAKSEVNAGTITLSLLLTVIVLLLCLLIPVLMSPIRFSWSGMTL